jgi:hypothetical protein
VLAAGIIGTGTMEGMIAPRVEDDTAKPPDCTTTRASSSPTDRTPTRAWASRTSVTAQVTIDDHR